MRDHERVIALRKAGKRPAAVFLNIGHKPPSMSSWIIDPEDPAPEVWTHGSVPSRADLSFLIGLDVHVACYDTAGADVFWEWFDALTAAKAKSIYGVDPTGEVIEWHL